MMRILLVTVVSLGFLSATHAADPKTLTLSFFGQSFFVLTTSAGTRIAFDPHGLEPLGKPTVKADAVIISHPHPDHNKLEAIENRASAKVFEGIKVTPPAGEGAAPKMAWNPVDETFKDVKIRTVGTFHDRMQGMQRGRNMVFIVEADGLKFVHLGDLGHTLSEDQIQQIGPVDVLMIPVGGVYTLNGSRAKEVIEQLKPKRYILPMHYGTIAFSDVLPPDEFLDGLTGVQKLPTNDLKIQTDSLPPAPVVVMPAIPKR